MENRTTTASPQERFVPVDDRIADPANLATTIRTLIVDDQLIARELLRRMLKDQPDIEIVGTAGTGPEAVEAILQLSPDLVFLDVRMPDLDGFEVISKISPDRMPVIIFVTANDDFARQAFDVHALDYLVKPCSSERFIAALDRVRRQLRRPNNGRMVERLSALIEDLRTEPRGPARLAVKAEGRIIFVKLTDVDWIEAADNYVKLHAGNDSHLLRETMNALESRLPHESFMRISRSTIVNIERIKELHPMFHGEYVVVLRNGTQLTLTRSYREKLGQLGIR
jgi:two-component system LytT family response regulator